jgi:hypothetical protein
MDQNDFTYTISCINLQSFLSVEAKSLGFRSFCLHHRDDQPRPCPGQGWVIWDAPLNEKEVTAFQRLTGLEFLVHHPHMRTVGFFSFLVIEGAYYCFREGSYTHDDNPFKIRTFKLDGGASLYEASTNSVVMLRHPRFLHIQRDTLGPDGQQEDHLCFSKTKHQCDVCQALKDVLVLHINSSIGYLCNPCFTTLITTTVRREGK